jgi:hypothetical protein
VIVMPTNAYISRGRKLCHGRQWGLPPDKLAQLLGKPTADELRQQEEAAKHAATRKAFAEDQERIRALINARREQQRYEAIARQVHQECMAQEQEPINP